MPEVKFREWILVLSVTGMDDRLITESEADAFLDDIMDLADRFNFSLGGGVVPQSPEGRLLSDAELEATRLLAKVRHELEGAEDAREACLIIADLVGAKVRN